MIRLRTITRKAVRSADLLQRIGREIRDVLHSSALEIERGAKRRAPVATGRLRASIATHGPEVHDARVGFVVAVGAFYGKFLEFGTGPAGAASPLSATAREAMAKMGYEHRPAARTTMRARPYLFPAFEEVRPKVAPRVRERVRRVLGA
jgi:HK97 gp10 family phage protein